MIEEEDFESASSASGSDFVPETDESGSSRDKKLKKRVTIERKRRQKAVKKRKDLEKEEDDANDDHFQKRIRFETCIFSNIVKC